MWSSKLPRGAEVLLKGASAAFVVKVLAAAAQVALNVFLARSLGPDHYGDFLLALTVVTVASVFARLGMGNTLVRFVAGARAVDDDASVNGVYAIAMKVAAIGTLIATAAVYFGSSWIGAGLFSNTELVPYLAWSSVAIPAIALLFLHSDALKGLKSIAKSQALFSLVIPAFTLVFAVFLVGRWEIGGAVAAYGLAAWSGLGLGWYWWRSETKNIRHIGGTFDRSRLFASSVPLFGVSILMLVNQWTGTLALGYWADSADVGLFGVAMRLATLTSFVLLAVNSIAAPKFAELHRQERMRELAETARSSALLMTLAAAPVLLLFTLAPEWILSWFGEDFRAAKWMLVILAVGQFVNVATGSVGCLLMMTGNERMARLNLCAVAATSLVLNVWLVPLYGALGAAWAMAISQAAQNLIASMMVYSKLGIVLIPGVDRLVADPVPGG